MLQIITEKEDFRGIALEMMQWAADNMPAQNLTTKPDIMTGEELCQKLDVTIQTLIRWRHKGKIPYFQIGSSIRYDFNKVLDSIEVSKKKGLSK
jgi:hypothetical protein